MTASPCHDSIYRRYFIAAILATLTAGAGWGVWLLWRIGAAGAFTGVSVHDINAHGHVQIFGWVGLFIMGFAYQMLPRFWHTRLVAPPLASLVFVTMIIGLCIRTAGMAADDLTLGLSAAMVGGTMELVGILAFVGQMIITRQRSPLPFGPNVLFIYTALVFFLLQAAFGLWHTWSVMAATTRQELLWHLATYQAVLRDLQIHGLALFMILGVGLYILPQGFDLPRIAPRRAYAAWALLLTAVVGETTSFLAFRWTASHAMAASLLLSWVLLAVGALMIPWTWRLWRPLPARANRDRSAKFIRAAYGWLAISMIMLPLMPLYQWLADIPFSHAYYGAVRHAITVGFISLMIMGVAAKVVPALAGADLHRLPRLWGPFLLVNLGCLLRVTTQTAIDWHPTLFNVVGVSGTLEIIGLAWWGIHLIRIMLSHGRPRRVPYHVGQSRLSAVSTAH